MMSIVYRSVRSRLTLLSRPRVKSCSARALTSEAHDSPPETKSVHISIFDKGFSYQPGARTSIVEDLSSAEISAQAAALRFSLGAYKAALRRSDKLLKILKQHYDPSTHDKASRSIAREDGDLKAEKATKPRRKEESKANVEAKKATKPQRKEESKANVVQKEVRSREKSTVEKLQPYRSRKLPESERLKSFAAVQNHEGHWNIEVTAGRAVNSFNVPQTWLRDHCQCLECINPDTKQRQFNIFAFPEPPQIKECSVDKLKVNVTWNDEHKSIYSTEWLKETFDVKNKVLERQGYVKPAWWKAETAQNPPEVDFNDVMNPYDDKGLAEWMLKTRRYGFCFVNNTPPSPKATEDLLNRIGPIRNTHYGAFWDFTSNLAHKDTAYTDLALDVHTDTNYFTDSAGLQLFHLLSHEGTGGSSQLVDGFAVANALYNQDRAAYEILAKVKMFYHSSGNEGLSIQPHGPCPVLVHDEVTDMLAQVRWNPYDKAAMVMETGRQPEELEEWYRAATLWDKMTKQDSPKFRYEFQLKPGRPLLFDNWRTLHGRSAFTGKRRMCGGYINRDDYISCFRTTNYGHGHVLKHGIY